MIIRKLDGFVRACMVHFLSGPCGLIVVNEFPKSGATWLSQMLSQALSLPFPRNKVPNAIPCIIQGHYKRKWGMKNVIVLWRDVRDVMVSWYFYCLFSSEKTFPSFVRTNRLLVSFRDYENVEKNMPSFLQYCFDTQKQPGFTWPEFVRVWHEQPGVIYVRYEDLKKNAEFELQKICRKLGAELSLVDATGIVKGLSFEVQTGRNSGNERVGDFLRKGIVGDWVNYFNREASEIINKYAGEELILLNYERDADWVKSRPAKIDRDDSHMKANISY